MRISPRGPFIVVGARRQRCEPRLSEETGLPVLSSPRLGDHGRGASPGRKECRAHMRPSRTSAVANPRRASFGADDLMS